LWQSLVEEGLIDDSTDWQRMTVLGFELHSEVSIKKYPALFRKFSRYFYFRKDYLLRQLIRSIAYRKQLILVNLANMSNLFEAVSIGSRAK
jgi:hypothetical protein